MIKYSELQDILTSNFKIPIAYKMFLNKTEAPFITFYQNEDDSFYADNYNYFSNINVTIELYTSKKDIKLENQVKDLLKIYDLTYVKYESYIEEQKLYIISFNFKMEE